MTYTSGYTNWLIALSLFFVLFLFALIGFNIVIQTTPTGFLFELIVEFLKDFSLFINVALIFFTCAFGVPLVLVWWRYFSARDPIIKKNYTASELEQKILHIVAKKKGKFISPVTIRKKLRFRGTLEELKSVLQRLRQEKQNRVR